MLDQMQPPLTANAEILLFDELTRSTNFKSSVELSVNLGINHDKVMSVLMDLYTVNIVELVQSSKLGFLARVKNKAVRDLTQSILSD